MRPKNEGDKKSEKLPTDENENGTETGESVTLEFKKESNSK